MSEWAGCCCLQCIREKEVGVIEDLGEQFAWRPGALVLIWPSGVWEVSGTKRDVMIISKYSH